MDGEERKEDRNEDEGRTRMEVVLWRQLGGSTSGLSSIGPKTFF